MSWAEMARNLLILVLDNNCFLFFITALGISCVV